MTHEFRPIPDILERELFNNGTIGGWSRRLWTRARVVGGAGRGRRRACGHWRGSRRAKKARRAVEKESKARRNDNQPVLNQHHDAPRPRPPPHIRQFLTGVLPHATQRGHGTAPPSSSHLPRSQSTRRVVLFAIGSLLVLSPQ